MYSKNELESIVKNVRTYSEIFVLLKINKSTSNYNKLKKNIKEWGIDISHFLTRKDILNRANESVIKSLKEILVKDSTYNCGNSIKDKLYKEGLKNPICEIEGCGVGEIWLGNKISLVLDHIDGDHYNNEITNLRILCPNCHAATSTFAGRNRKSNILKNKRKQVRENLIKLKIITRKNSGIILSDFKIIVENSKINFSKKGWGIELGKLINRSPQYTIKLMKNYLPEFANKCFKHNKNGSNARVG